jgi:hypothetical protein
MSVGVRVLMPTQSDTLDENTVESRLPGERSEIVKLSEVFSLAEPQLLTCHTIKGLAQCLR